LLNPVYPILDRNGKQVVRTQKIDIRTAYPLINNHRIIITTNNNTIA